MASLDAFEKALSSWYANGLPQIADPPDSHDTPISRFEKGQLFDEWLYNSPTTGSSTSLTELEDSEWIRNEWFRRERHYLRRIVQLEKKLDESQKESASSDVRLL